MVDSSGYYNFIAKYNGSNELKSSEKELAVRDVILKVELGIDEDSVKIINISSFSFAADNEEIPLEEADIYCYVKRSFGNLTIGEGFMEDGELEVTLDEDFNIPGNADGEIIVITRIEDNDVVGTVEKENLVKWGTPTIQSDESANSNLPWWSKYIVIMLLFVAPIIILFSQIFKFYKMGKFSKSV